MRITSIPFILFIAATVILCRALPKKWRWAVLLAASVVFYVTYSVVGILILTGTALVTYFAALRIQKIQDEQAKWMADNRQTADKEEKKAKRKESNRRQRRYVILVVALSVGLLFLFKYYGYFASSINRAFATHLWTAENLLLPLGISFYSLQLIGYVVDVSRGILPAERNPLKVVLYGAFFLSIMQGPFNRYNDLMPQICNDDPPKLNFYTFKLAVLRITWGYIKKMCIADQVGCIATEVFSNYANYSGLGIILGVICFPIQLYADFSGYMDIVSGIGELLGIQMPINFRQPFFSRNMSEFWQRWHITLGAWLKDYVFYPILKSNVFQSFGKWLTGRVGKEAGRRIPTYLGMIILWTLIGAWHGAGFNYVFGVGLLQFIYIFLGEITAPVTGRLKDRLHIKEESLPWHIFQSLRCTALMIFAWVFFNSKTFMDAIGVLGRIFADRPGLGQITAVFEVVAGTWKIWLPYVFLCVIALFVVDLLCAKGLSVRAEIEKRPYPIRMWIYLAAIFTIIIFGAYGTQFDANDFIYFQF